MASVGETVRIGVLAYDGAQKAAVYGLTDLLRMANSFWADKTQNARVFDVSIIEGDVDGWAELARDPFDVIVLPPSLQRVPRRDSAQDGAGVLVGRLAEHHQKGTLMCSVCAGAFLLAEAGLLTGRRATTHWALAQELRAAHPDIILDTEKLIVDDGDVITAGGITAWIDLGLLLVNRFMSPSVMLETARYFLVDPVGREQRFYSAFVPVLGHGDEAIVKVQHWLQSNYGESVSVEKMAGVAGLERRTFIRRFQKAALLNPSDYLQQLRVGQAKERLELSTLNVEEVSRQVGYEDVSAFRRVFQKISGLTPREYRKRFSVHQSR